MLANARLSGLHLYSPFFVFSFIIIIFLFFLTMSIFNHQICMVPMKFELWYQKWSLEHLLKPAQLFGDNSGHHLRGLILRKRNHNHVSDPSGSSSPGSTGSRRHHVPKLLTNSLQEQPFVVQAPQCACKTDQLLSL